MTLPHATFRQMRSFVVCGLRTCRNGEEVTIERFVGASISVSIAKRGKSPRSLPPKEVGVRPHKAPVRQDSPANKSTG